VKTFLKFVTSDATVAGTGGLPAYKAAADAWLDAQAASGFYAGDFKAAIQAAASSVWNGWGYPNFSPETAWAKIVTPGLAAGKTMTDLAADWQQEMQNEAQVVGYTVE
jgi:multiple sugar transport system substrate-binding protein